MRADDGQRTAADSLPLEQAVDRFEDAWQRGERPALDATIAALPAGAPSTVVYAVAPETTEGLVALASRYRVTRRHARGGLGEILVARDEVLHREVALKRLQPERAQNDDSRQRFLRE